MSTNHKTPLAAFLDQNPFPYPMTLGFFYREKMRAIHRVSPEAPLRDILEVGGGKSGMAAMLYPNAIITNIDLNAEYADAPCNQLPNVKFLCADATALPFDDNSFDAITMFDLLEHVPDDAKAIAEAKRVLRPGGYLLVSTPHPTWRYPYYKVLKPICPPEEELFAEWGHVRRGYSLGRLQKLIAMPRCSYAYFISPLTALCHDIAFSRLPERVRRALCKLIFPITYAGYTLHHPHQRGTETASAWRMGTKN
jgi:ubiquinone/menaquinone biosynthesis C-methylase UbiE